MKLRIQHKAKKHTLEIPDDANIAQLVDQVESIINEPKFSLKTGFPPKPLNVNDPSLTLKEAQLRSGEALIVELPSNVLGNQASSNTSMLSKDIATTQSQEVFNPSGRKKEVLQGNFSFGGAQAASKTRTQDDTDLPPEITVSGKGILTLRVQPDDNSCLFRAIGYLCMRSIDAMEELRQVIATTIQENPVEYSEAVLGMNRDVYCRRINRPDTWGGEIEMKILSDHFNVQIASVDCKSGHIYRYGESFSDCIYIVYSGIHYDAIALMPTANAPPDWDQTQFGSHESDIASAATELVGLLRKRNYFTDTASFDLRCNDCGAGLKGESGAQQHAIKTGHVNFGEFKA